MEMYPVYGSLRAVWQKSEFPLMEMYPVYGSLQAVWHRNKKKKEFFF
jgi:hypothetical protein